MPGTLAPEPGGLSEVRRACVFAQLDRPGLGDMVQRNILLARLADALPRASVTLVVGESLAGQFADLIRNHLLAADVLTCPDPGELDGARWLDVIRELTRRRFELCVVDPGTHTLDAFHARAAGIGRRVAKPAGQPHDRHITHPVRLPPSVLGHPDLYEYAVAFARALDTTPPRPAEVVPSLPVRPEAVPELAAPRPRVGVHPGGQTNWHRRWPLERYAELCVRLVDRAGASIYLLGDEREVEELDILEAVVRDRCPAAVMHRNTERSLNRMANMLAGLDVLVGNDSGLAHLAAAVHTPTVVLYGPSGTEPVFSRAYSRHRGVSLRYPCQLIPRGIDQADQQQCERACPLPYLGPRGPYPQCLMDIDVDRVWVATTAQLRAYQATPGGIHER